MGRDDRTQIDLSRALRQGLRLEAENRLLRAEGRPTLIAESPASTALVVVVSRGFAEDASTGVYMLAALSIAPG